MGGAPEHFSKQGGARVILGTNRHIGGDHIG
jgi:hypothetical protein